jgi:hypothetical protein
MHGYIIHSDMGNNSEGQCGGSGNRTRDIWIQRYTTLDAITTIPWSHILIELLPEVDHILKKYWLRIYNNISFPYYITK